MTRNSSPNAHTHPTSHRLRYELIAASLLLAFGLFALPGLVYWVGNTLLGPYGSDKPAGMGALYGDFYGDLATGVVRAWILALGPLVVIGLVRLLFLRRSPDPSSEDRAAPPQAAPHNASDARRVEPRVSLD